MVSEPTPEATIVVLTYDRPHELGRCLRSLLTQETKTTFEVVVADDGSGPATAAVVRSVAEHDSRVRHVRGEHRGIAAARNLGLRAARGVAYVSFVADDYVLAPRYLETAIAYLEATPEADVVRFRVTPTARHLGARVSHSYYDASVVRRLLTERAGGDTRQGALVDVQAGETTTLEAAGAAVFRRATLDGVGGWDETLSRAEDTEMTARLRAAGYSVHFHPAATVGHEYRRIPTDTMRKCLSTGYHRARLARSSGKGVAGGKVSGLAVLLMRARANGSTGRAILAIPWLVLFEALVLMGYTAGMLSSTRALGRTPPRTQT